jgi:tetratricopeptide (TPR) repeat protein
MAKLRKSIWIGLSGIGIVAVSLFLINRMQAEKAEESFRAGEASLAAGRTSDAIALFQESFDIDPNHPAAGFLLFDTTLLVEPDNAEEILIRLVKTKLPDDRITARRIVLQIEKGDFAEAIQLRESLAPVSELDFDRAYAEILVDLASTKTELGEESLQYLLDQFPNDRRVLLVEARILQTSPKKINHVRAKTLLKDLLKQKDLISFKAARLLVVLSRIPMFEEDFAHALAHLLKHPYLDKGLRKMELSNLRLLALRSVEHDAEAAFRFAQALVNREGATDNDHLLYLSIAQKTGDKSKETGPVISRLRQRMEDNTDFQLVLARQDFLEGNLEDMVSKLEKVLDSDPGNLAALNLLLPFVGENSPDMSKAALASALDMLIGYPLTPAPDRLLAYS